MVAAPVWSETTTQLEATGQTAQTGAANGTAIDMRFARSIAWQITWSATAAGITVIFESTLDEDPVTGAWRSFRGVQDDGTIKTSLSATANTRVNFWAQQEPLSVAWVRFRTQVSTPVGNVTVKARKTL